MRLALLTELQPEPSICNTGSLYMYTVTLQGCPMFDENRWLNVSESIERLDAASSQAQHRKGDCDFYFPKVVTYKKKNPNSTRKRGR